ncbi:MAG: ABC transporter ATP-binding protein [Alphaproteobacteria bacterium]|nr:ABC transporter ATP-binding protein [Alphaproteobacteria bacterium]
MEKSASKFIWHYAKIFKIALVTMLVLLVIGQICRQITPYYLAKIYETISGYSGIPSAWQNLISFIFLAFLTQLLGTTIPNSGFIISAKITPKIRTLVIRDVFDYVNKHSIAFFSHEMAGNISNKVQQLQSGVTELFHHSLDSIWSVCYALIGVIILSSVSLWLTPVFLLWAVAIISLGLFLGKKLHKLSKDSSTKQSIANGMIVDSLANYSEIKSFANFKFERVNLLKALRILRKAESKEEIGRAVIIFAQHFAVVISFMLFLLYTAWLFKNGVLTSTDFIFVNGLFYTMSGVVFNITYGYNQLSRVLGRINSALETLAVDPEIIDSPRAENLRIKKAEISFCDVGFSYKDNREIFTKLNVNIKAGEKIGLVGASGAGKSTFIKLLARYFDVRNGCIKINGKDIRDVTQESLHKHIATIPQDVCLFNRSLKDNIRYGRTNASDKEIIAAAKTASAHDFIKNLASGYDTKVGDRGVILSGGERQRIAIARAVLKNAPILIFDEATSSLDTENEKHIQESLSKLMKGKTVIAVAHRLSTLKEMDRILVFDNGKIIEEGNHDELLNKQGKYAKLFKMQSGGFLR